MNQIASELLWQFEQFIDNAKVTVLSTDGVSIESVFESYFQQTPPFSEGKKKHEFPDAFTVAVLEKWCKDNDEAMYVISGDQDLATYCNASTKLISLNKPEAFLELLTLEHEYIRSIEREIFQSHLEDIKALVLSQFSDLPFWLEDQNGDVDSITIITLDLVERFLIGVFEDVLHYETNFRLIYAAAVSYDDPDYIYYDKEDGEYHALEQAKAIITQEEILGVEVRLSFRRTDPVESEIEDVLLDVDQKNGIFLSIDEN